MARAIPLGSRTLSPVSYRVYRLFQAVKVSQRRTPTCAIDGVLAVHNDRNGSLRRRLAAEPDVVAGVVEQLRADLGQKVAAWERGHDIRSAPGRPRDAVPAAAGVGGGGRRHSVVAGM